MVATLPHPGSGEPGCTIREQLVRILRFYTQPPFTAEDGAVRVKRELLSQAADEIERLRDRLRDNRCPVDVRGTIGECVDSGQCGCTNGLVLRSHDEQKVPADEPSEVTIRRMRDEEWRS